MTPDLRLLSGFAGGVSLSLHVRVTCLHSVSWLLSGSMGCRGQPSSSAVRPILQKETLHPPSLKILRP